MTAKWICPLDEYATRTPGRVKTISKPLKPVPAGNRALHRKPCPPPTRAQGTEALHLIRWPTSVLILCLALPALGGDPTAGPGDGRHRLDFTVTTIDAGEGDAYSVLPGYTLTLNNQLRVGISSSYTFIESDTELVDSGSGLGDTDILVQYDPSQQITSSPWIPDSVGIVGGLTVPTGNADKYLGLDQWIYRLGVGWAHELTAGLYLAPSIEYSSSFAGDGGARRQEFGGIGLSLVWLTANGFWLGYTPYVERDLVVDKWADHHTLIVGKMWPRGLGMGIEYSRLDRIDRGAARDDYTMLFNFYYQFGRPR